MAKHLKPPGKEHTRHCKNRDMCIAEVDELAKNGWRLEYPAMRICAYKGLCGVCKGKSDVGTTTIQSYEAFHHIETSSSHKKCLVQSMLPPEPRQDDSAASVWEAIIADHRSASGAAAAAAGAAVA